MSQFIASICQLRSDKRGVTALEYGLIAGAIAVALVAAFGGLADNIKTALLALNM